METHKLCADVHVIPALKDNFSYLFVDRRTNLAACVDPANPMKTIAKAQELGVQLTTCFTTHRHWDHAGGNSELQRSMANLNFVASAYEETPCTTHAVKHGDRVSLGTLSIQALYAPCHTRGHILYYVTDSTSEAAIPMLFTGDTLFIAGCGRFFEGDAKDMLNNMRMIRDLRPDTRLFVGHEYTVKNLKFAETLEPKRSEVLKKLKESVERAERHEPTVPGVLSEEMTYNPFLRFDDPELMQALGTADSEATLAECRRRKDQF